MTDIRVIGRDLVNDIRVIVDGQEPEQRDITRTVNRFIVAGAVIGLVIGWAIARLP